MNLTEQTCADLKEAARYMLLDGHSLDAEEAVRIGIRLAELAGTMSALVTKMRDTEQ